MTILKYFDIKLHRNKAQRHDCLLAFQIEAHNNCKTSIKFFSFKLMYHPLNFCDPQKLSKHNTTSKLDLHVGQ